MLVRFGVDKFPGYSNRQHQRDIPDVEDEIVEDESPLITPENPYIPATIIIKEPDTINGKSRKRVARKPKNGKPGILAPADGPQSFDEDDSLLEKLQRAARRRERTPPAEQKVILARIAKFKRSK